MNGKDLCLILCDVWSQFANVAPSALTGALLVLASDFIGCHVLPVHYPVGVITGLLGAPYMLYLLIAMNKKGEF